MGKPNEKLAGALRALEKLQTGITAKTDLLRIPDYLEHILEAIGRTDLYLADADEIAPS